MTQLFFEMERSNMGRLQPLLLLTTCFLASFIHTTLADVTAEIDEELNIGSYVLDLKTHKSIFNNLDDSQIPFLTYGLLGQDTSPANLFRVDADNGEITVARRIDRETLCDPIEVCEVSFNVAIRSKTGAPVPFSNVVEITIIINDINDNPPRFPARDVTLEVSEGAKVGTELKISGAVDRDYKTEFTVRHYNHTPNLPEFSIRPTTNPDGSSTINLRLEKELDRETTDSYVFNIIAYDGGDSPKSDYLRVNVIVTDDNDNTPMFNNGKYELTINENANVGSTVGQVTATDADIGEYGRIWYSFSQSSESAIKGVFAINSSTGVITLEGDLDTIRRSASPFYMYVDARDGGEPPRTNQTLVSVTVLDSGNNAPFIRVDTVSDGDASTLTIPESAGIDYFVAFVEVTDYDDAENGMVTCQVAGTDFKLRLLKGKKYTLLLNRTVDRESKNSYDVLINCQDRGTPPLDTSVTLVVNITDENDNDPKFHDTLYSASVPENRLAGHFIAKVSADDIDFGPNAEIVYSLPEEASPYLRIHPKSGIISTTSKLDREANKTLEFEIYATDQGKIPRTGVAKLYITVTDENDNAPQFVHKDDIFIQIPESTKNGTVIRKLEAYDNDTGVNGMFDFYFGGSITGDMPLPFTVLKDGTIIVSGFLDRESTADYSFSVLVRDRGDKPMSSMAPVSVKILDENDNDPVILFPTSRNHSIVITEFPEKGFVVGKVIAYDVDEGDASALRFSIYEGNEDGAFAIDPVKGDITLVNIGKLKNPHEYFLSVKVEDSTSNPRNATTELRVEFNFSNTSGLYGNQDGAPAKSRDQYVIIVGVIGGATIVLSVIIISAIVIILRSERGKRNDSGGVFIGRNSRGGFFKNKFFGGNASSEQSSHDTSKNTTDESLDGTKSHSESSLLATNPDPNGLVLNPGNLGGGVGGVKKADDVQKKVSFSLDVQDDFQGHHHQDKQLRMNLAANMDHGNQWKKQYNAPDDLHSDTSGESGTCDSGRGTSDEDIKFDHSPNRGLNRQPNIDPFLMHRGLPMGAPPQYSQLPNMNILPTPERVQTPVHNFQDRPLSPIHNMQQGHGRTQSPLPYIKPGQPRFLETGGVRPVADNLGRSSYHGKRQAPPHPAGNSASMRQPTNHRVFPTHKDVHSNPDLLRPGSAMSFTQQGSALSMDDDASTTTSGSYVINPDDVRLDALLGKDVIV